MMLHPDGPSFLELTRQALSSTRDGYDLLAPKFDVTPYRTPNQLVDALAEHIPDDATDAIDVCCGTGAGLEMLLRNDSLTRIVGIDFSAGMLEQAHENLGKTGSRLEWVEGDVLAMDFQNQFDVAICLGALGHFVGADYELLLRRIHDSLKPGGRYLFPVAPAPKRFSKLYWFCLGFNSAIYIRNLFLKPPFIMYYHDLMFEGEGLKTLLEKVGFDTAVVEAGTDAVSDGLVQPGFQVMVATKI